ncbi:MAG: hypothetical protein U5M23_15355 [Marinagarivorans sp.]|nr:hypothetical protein [Marinagarivorans sp.]
MIILDSALKAREKQGNPVRVGIIGAGFMGRGLALQIIRFIPGMDVVAISNRSLKGAQYAYEQAGRSKVTVVDSAVALDRAIENGESGITSDPYVLCESKHVDVLIEATGELEFGAHVCFKAFACKKHIVLMNAELDATLGPLLKKYADDAGVVITNADGDQPGVIMNLFRYVETIGFKPVLAGNMKGLQDAYRTPATQAAFAAEHKQKPHMVTSFADGSKISMEMAVVANATGFKSARRGMYGYECKRVEEAANLFNAEEMLNGGLVDYVLGAQPGGGVFVIGHCDDPIQMPYMRYYKMGDGPFYVFYTPYHLPHIEGGLTAARAALFNDAATMPLAGPVCEVLTLAKCNLAAGTEIDEIGGFHTYGVLDNSQTVIAEGLLPMGMARGCRLKRSLAKDAPILFDDIEINEDRLIDRLYKEQIELFNV